MSNNNNEPIHPLNDLIKKSVGNTLAEAKLGSSTEFEDYVANCETERILREISKMLSLKRLLKLQFEFAGMKRKYTKQAGREKGKAKATSAEAMQE